MIQSICSTFGQLLETTLENARKHEIQGIQLGQIRGHSWLFWVNPKMSANGKKNVKQQAHSFIRWFENGVISYT